MEKGGHLPRPAHEIVGNRAEMAIPVVQQAQHLPHCFCKEGKENDDQAIEVAWCKVQLNVFAGKCL